MYVIYLTTQCNYQCLYCYENFNQVMDIDINGLYRVLDFIFKYDNSNKIEIAFMGGEPLLKIDIIYNAVAHIETKYNNRIVKYFMTTNCTLLTDVNIEFFRSKHFNMRLSFDGMRKAHSINRKNKNGTSDYDLILANILKIRDSGITYSIRMTITPATIPMLFNNIVYLHEYGLNSICMILDIYSSISKEIYEIFKEQMELITEYYLEESDKGRKFALDQFDGKFFNILADFGSCFSMCDAGIQNFKILPDGNIYPCGFVADNPDFIIGNIDTSIDIKLAKKIAISLFDGKDQKCKECKIKNFCYGMKCGYMNYLLTGKINVPSELTCIVEKIYYPLVMRIVEHLRKQEINQTDDTLGKAVKYLLSQNLKLTSIGMEINHIILNQSD